ncbi:hypothetical protein SARC_02660 [Sphaeroforma arctica JP610]|uniref:Uncharacterized protein n=1 Tax=Sphaeroforma arctica JP610 TaxID=667725 RepID=A0A0L0G8D5_9EUKA|nr:hypothetical protein SARC_02660 [Sphaeroforma arctica JP610]KNC85136.1 hypothetical protein SARC_02660 [Sphaeroforma arctica JP610]|eukprot:XP_014159038.1 hypothetical protein SARC_02660 [Sphaeroforma arctica JP610]
MCAFVFLQVDNKPVRFTMQQKEVSAVLWAPVRMLHPASVHFSEVVLPYRILALQNWLPESINHRLGLDTLCFPSIALHELKNVVVCHQRQLDPGTPGEEFVLWGMTLRATSALVHFVDVPRLDWPPATVNNRVLNWVVQIVASCMRYTNPDVVRRWHG